MKASVSILVLVLATTACSMAQDIPPTAINAPPAAAANPTVVNGVPLPSTAKCGAVVTHDAYVACVDNDLKIPLWVAYRLTGEHTLGCLPRTNAFHADEALPAGQRATPKDYAKSGYDMGHQAPDKDFAWDAQAEHDSFSMANMAPQLPGLNRMGWESLEEDVRVWAWDRGALVVYVGPVMDKSPKRIGNNGVAVPSAFWKVVVDEKTREALAFEMPQANIPKGDISPYLKGLSDVEADSGTDIPGLLATSSAIWAIKAKDWRAAKKAACR